MRSQVSANSAQAATPGYDVGYRPEADILNNSLEMQIQTQAFGPYECVPLESDIDSLTWDGGQLTVKLAQVAYGQSVRVQGLNIVFSNVRSFRVLDEADLATYWMSPGFVRDSHVLKVHEGGWRDEESARQGLDFRANEWPVVTGNACVNVFSAIAPTIERADWDW